jgi:hypothetical protein
VLSPARFLAARKQSGILRVSTGFDDLLSGAKMFQQKLMRPFVALCVGLTALSCGNKSEKTAAPADSVAAAPKADTVSYNGWKLHLIGVRTDSGPTHINNPTFGLGEAKGGNATEKITPKGVLWIVSIGAAGPKDSSADTGGEPGLQARNAALIDGKGNTAMAIAGGPSDGSMWFKGMFIGKSGDVALLFDFPADAKDVGLKIAPDAPLLHVR